MDKIEQRQTEIRLLDYLLSSLCNSELPETGRKAITRLRNKLSEEIKNEACNTEEQITDHSWYEHR